MATSTWTVGRDACQILKFMLLFKYDTDALASTAIASTLNRNKRIFVESHYQDDERHNDTVTYRADIETHLIPTWQPVVGAQAGKSL